MFKENPTIAVIGLGYVGLPLAVHFAKFFNVVGFDINNKRVMELKDGKDRTLEVDSSELKTSKVLFTDNENDLLSADIYIVTVPTPVDANNHPDLSPLISASKVISKYLKADNIVVYESTVYPGCTEEICVPILEKSGLKLNNHFYCGYSPERVNPGDKEKNLTKILKIVSGSTKDVSDYLKKIYGTIITAGIYQASSIKVAEAAKVIENAQRDINIAFVNELSLIFERMGIDTLEVLEAAATKWNFIHFKPGLVGGHCIGVDPYYLTYKAQALGYHSQVILSGRRINDNMGIYVANQVIKKMIKKHIKIQDAKVLVLGVTFKENCPDIRNSRVIDIIREMEEYGCNVEVNDPKALANEVKEEYGIRLKEEIGNLSEYAAVILAVGHSEYKDLHFQYDLKSRQNIFFDLKGLLPKDFTDGRL